MELTLPDLKIETSAELLSNNFDTFAEKFREGIKKFSYELLNPDDFKQAAKDIKTLKETEGVLIDAKKQILEGNADVSTLLSKLSELQDEAATLRKTREKAVKESKVKFKTALIEKGWRGVDNHSNHTLKDTFTKALHGMSSEDKMVERVESLQQEINARIESHRAVIAQYESDHGADVVRGKVDLELKTSEEVLRAVLDKRVAEERAMRERIIAEETRKKAAEKAAPAPAPAPIQSIPVQPHRTQEAQLSYRDYSGLLLTKMKSMVSWYHNNKRALSAEDVKRIDSFRDALNAAYKKHLS